MPSTPKVFSLLDDAAVLDAFKLIVSVRKIRLKDLVDKLQTNKEDASKWLSQLKEADLISEEPASIDDFNIYYVTSQGLSVDRKLRR